MEKETQEGKDMRDLIDQMTLLEEQAQVNQQPANQQQKQQKSPQEQIFDAFVAAITKEFLLFIRQKQQKARQKQQQGGQTQQGTQTKGVPGFNPIPGAGLYQIQ